MIIGLGTGVAYMRVAAGDAPAAVQSKADYICDGVDDQVQINTALGQAALVFLSEGSYSLSAPVVVPSGAVLAGSGFASKLTLTGSGNAVELVGTSGGYLAAPSVRDLQLVGPSPVEAGKVAGSGVFIRYADDPLIEHITVSGFGSLGDDGGIALRNTARARVTGCYVTNCENGIILGVATDAGQTNAGPCIVLNTCGTNRADGIHTQHAQRPIYSQNRCYGNGEAGIDLLGDTDGVVQGNICTGNAGSGIEVGNTTATGVADSGHSFTGNTCANNTGNGIHVLGQTVKCLFSGNTCANNTSRGIMLQGGVISTAVVEDNMVQGNFTVGNGSHGIYLVNGQARSSVLGNTSRNNGARGIYLTNAGNGDPTDITVIGNVTSGNTTSPEISDAGGGANILSANQASLGAPLSGPGFVEISQTAYDALSPGEQDDPDKFYVITS